MSDLPDQIWEDLSREVLTQQQRSDLLQVLQHPKLQEVEALKRLIGVDNGLSPETLNSLLKNYPTIQNAFDSPFEYSHQDLQQGMAEFYNQYDTHSQDEVSQDFAYAISEVKKEVDGFNSELSSRFHDLINQLYPFRKAQLPAEEKWLIERRCFCVVAVLLK
jgi:hypothetical protein